jgi:hypothetical protein
MVTNIMNILKVLAFIFQRRNIELLFRVLCNGVLVLISDQRDVHGTVLLRTLKIKMVNNMIAKF